MSDGPGAPKSPHDDGAPVPFEPWPGPRPRRADESGTRAADASRLSLPPQSSAVRPNSRPGVPDAARGAAGRPGGVPPSPPAGPVSRQPARDPWTQISLAEISAETMKIGVWGSPQSGKSTFLAALPHATINAHRSLGAWNLIPLTEPSSQLLSQWSDQIVTDRKFPEATPLAAETELLWRFWGELKDSKFQSPWHRARRLPESTVFDLDLIDVNGEVFGVRPAERSVQQHVVDRALSHLADAKGLIFLFDPISELLRPTVQQYMNRPLAELTRLIETRGRTIRGRLPHYISVCVTKFDDPRLFQQACQAGFVNTGRDGRPCVLDNHAEAFFEALCEGTFWTERDDRGAVGPQYVREMLRHHFDPDRIKYYVTSSIGFNMGADGQFDPARYPNVREGEAGPRIIGPVKPINVLEPLVELHMKLRGRV
jgi:hypothetical protein